MNRTNMKKIIDAEGVRRILQRIAHEISERNRGTRDLTLIGIPTQGVHLANRLARILQEMEGNEVLAGGLDTTLYRDDVPRKGPMLQLKRTDIPFSVNDRQVILVDDVLQTGRTIRAALDAITDLGRPRNIQLAVFIDRGGRELPIQADYIGKLLINVLNIPFINDGFLKPPLLSQFRRGNFLLVRPRIYSLWFNP